MPSFVSLKLIGGLVAALLLTALIADRGRWMHRAHGDEAQLARLCSAVRDASNNPNLACSDAPKQIKFLGESVTALGNSLRVQSEAVSALGDRTKQEQADSAKASAAAQPRAQKAEQISIHLDASSRSPADQQKPCEPSDVLKGAWR
jgi:hypothetical protein